MSTGRAEVVSRSKVVLVRILYLALLVVAVTFGIFSNSGSIAFASDYQVMASAGKGGQVSPATRNVVQGSSARFVVEPEPGYRTLDSVVGGNCPRGSWSGNAYTTGAITQDCSVNFRFFSSSYLVTALADRGGMVDPDTKVVTSGAAASFTVIPEPGHMVDTDVGGSCTVGSWSGNTYTTGAVSGNCSVNFSFPAVHRVAFSASQGGSLSPANQIVVHGSGTSVTVAPAPGFAPDMRVGGNCPEGSWDRQVYTTGPVTGDCAAVISFSAMRGVTATAASGGRVVPNRREVAVGGRVSFSPVPETGFITDVRVGGTCPSGSWDGDTYTTGRVAENCSVAFTFTPVVREVTASATAGSGGSVSVPVQIVNRGDRAVFTVAADSGYSINRSVGGSCPAGSWNGNNYVTSPINSDCSVNFTFASTGHQVVAFSAPGGAVDPVRRVVADGSNASFMVNPDPAFTVNNAVGGSCPGGGWSGNLYTTGPVRANCTVNFSFASEGHTVSAVSGFGGSVTQMVRSVVNGATASFTVIPDFGYARSTVVAGDCTPGSWIGNTYTTGPITNACSVDFSFHYIH